MNKRINYSIMAIILLILLVSGYLFFIKKDSSKVQKTSKTQDSSMEASNDSDEPSYVDEFTKQQNEPISMGENVKMSIIGPEEPTFLARQARMYQASLTELDEKVSGSATCHWKFYLNENNNEVLYKEMENSSVVSKDDLNICTFTSTFIEKRGTLRVKLDIELQNGFSQTIGTLSAERNYTVL